MTLGSATALIACSLFGAAMLHAVVTDLRHRRIRNWLVASLAALWPALAVSAGLPAGQMAAALAAAGLVFVAGFGCFAAGWLGGGDVKLASVAVLWLGAGQAPAFLLLTALLGAVLATAVLLTERLKTPPDPAQSGRRGREVPYAPALGLAGLALLNGSPWVAAL